MNDEDIKLTYVPSQARIRLVLTKAACDRHPQPPEELFQRAVTRLERGVADGSLEFYNTYRERLAIVWQRMREQKFKPDKKIAVTLAAGTPHLSGVTIEIGPSPFLASITIDARAEAIATWKFEFLKLTAQRRLKELRIEAHPDSAMLQAIFVRATRGKRIVKEPINAAPDIKGGTDHFSAMPRGVNGDLVLVINNISSIVTESARASIIKWLSHYVEQASTRGTKNYIFLKDDVEARLKSFLRGPERLSIDLPATILAALASNKPAVIEDTGEDFYKPLVPVKPHAPHQATKAAKSLSNAFNGDQYFALSVDSGKMAATVTINSDQAYREAASISNEQIEGWLHTKGITTGISQQGLTELKMAMETKSETKTFQVAAGIKPEHPENPYLHASYRTRQKEGGDIRDRQISAFVKTGELIAEIAFKKPGVEGKDVFGHTVPFKIPSLPPIAVGAHVQDVNGKKFYAEKDGLPQLTETSVAVEPAYIHKGNVNLATGNVVFDGPLIIIGNVELGAMVSASGDLEVQGVIEESSVKCGGNLTAAGIIAGPKGFVRVGGNATVAFLSNATMEVRGNLSVHGNISNSHLLVSGSIICDGPSATIVGGNIVFGETLSCKNLGKGSGHITTVTGGQNPILSRRISTLTKRLKRLEGIREVVKKGNRHLGNLKPLATSHKNAAKRENLKDALTHVTSIISRIQSQLTNLQEQHGIYDDTRITVTGTLAANCRITLNTKAIALTSDVVGAAVTAKRIKGSYITALAEEPSSSDGKKTA